MRTVNPDDTVTISLNEFDDMRDKIEAILENKIVVKTYEYNEYNYYNSNTVTWYFYTKDESILRLSGQIDLLNNKIEDKDREINNYKSKKFADSQFINMSLWKFYKWRRLTRKSGGRSN
jgi:hypothetical protein